MHRLHFRSVFRKIRLAVQEGIKRMRRQNFAVYPFTFTNLPVGISAGSARRHAHGLFKRTVKVALVTIASWSQMLPLPAFAAGALPPQFFAAGYIG